MHYTHASRILAEARRKFIRLGAGFQLRVIGMELPRAIEQSRFGFHSFDVGYTTLDGTNGLAGLLLVKTDAFGAKLRVDDVDVVAFGDCLVRAFGFTGTAVDTVLGNSCGHGECLGPPLFRVDLPES